jgi:hypothetical protein
MTILLFSNNAGTTLAANITDAQTTAQMAIGDGAKFPLPGAGEGFLLTFIDQATKSIDEIVLVTGMSGDNITSMVRAQEGSTARAWIVGDIMGNLDTAGAARAAVQPDQLQLGTYTRAVATGTGDTIEVTLPSELAIIPDGLAFQFMSTAKNVTNSPSLALTVSTTTNTHPIIDVLGAGIAVGYIPGANYPVQVVYSAALGGFIMTNPSVAPGTITSAQIITALGYTPADAAHQFGVAQTWQDLSGARTTGVDYTNGTTRPISVNVNFTAVITGGGTMKVDGVTAANVGASNSQIAGMLTVVVPSGSTYRVDPTGAGGFVSTWAELR